MIVVGAGVAGLACAGELARRGGSVVVLERAPAVGGRCATRRVFYDQPVDHGVPFFHARSHEFGVALNALDPDGKIYGWPVEVRGRRLACQRDAFLPGSKRWARREGVDAFPRLLARGLDVRFGVEVAALHEAPGAIEVEGADGMRMAAPIVVVAIPLTPSARLVTPLVERWPDAASRLERLHAITMVSTVALIAGYSTKAFDAPFEVWYPIESTMVHMVSHDSSKRPQPRRDVLVLHGRPRFSQESLERAPEDWSADLLWEAGELLGRWAARPAWTQAHVWRWSRVRMDDRLSDPVAFESPRGGRVAMIGEGFAPVGGLEGAYLTGVQMGEQIGTLPGMGD